VRLRVSALAVEISNAGGKQVVAAVCSPRFFISPPEEWLWAEMGESEGMAVVGGNVVAPPVVESPDMHALPGGSGLNEETFVEGGRDVFVGGPAAFLSGLEEVLSADALHLMNSMLKSTLAAARELQSRDRGDAFFWEARTLGSDKELHRIPPKFLIDVF